MTTDTSTTSSLPAPVPQARPPPTWFSQPRLPKWRPPQFILPPLVLTRFGGWSISSSQWLSEPFGSWSSSLSRGNSITSSTVPASILFLFWSSSFSLSKSMPPYGLSTFSVSVSLLQLGFSCCCVLLYEKLSSSS